jgi:hypothetical protein
MYCEKCNPQKIFELQCLYCDDYFISVKKELFCSDECNEKFKIEQKDKIEFKEKIIEWKNLFNISLNIFQDIKKQHPIGFKYYCKDCLVKVMCNKPCNIILGNKFDDIEL